MQLYRRNASFRNRSPILPFFLIMSRLGKTSKMIKSLFLKATCQKQELQLIIAWLWTQKESKSKDIKSKIRLIWIMCTGFSSTPKILPIRVRFIDTKNLIIMIGRIQRQKPPKVYWFVIPKRIIGDLITNQRINFFQILAPVIKSFISLSCMTLWNRQKNRLSMRTLIPSTLRLPSKQLLNCIIFIYKMGARVLTTSSNLRRVLKKNQINQTSLKDWSKPLSIKRTKKKIEYVSLSVKWLSI